jgi:hypothetical protein
MGSSDNKLNKHVGQIFMSLRYPASKLAAVLRNIDISIHGECAFQIDSQKIAEYNSRRLDITAML